MFQYCLFSPFRHFRSSWPLIKTNKLTINIRTSIPHIIPVSHPNLGNLPLVSSGFEVQVYKNGNPFSYKIRTFKSISSCHSYFNVFCSSFPAKEKLYSRIPKKGKIPQDRYTLIHIFIQEMKIRSIHSRVNKNHLQHY